MATPRICSIDGCDKPVKSRGWCDMHYVRWHTHGDPTFRKKPGNGEVVRFFREVVLTYEGDDCLFWPYGKYGSGYGMININRRSRTVSRVVCEEINGLPPSENYDAAHSCGNGHLGCVNPRHLSWKTRAENMADKVVHGTLLRGEGVGNSKLTECEVRQIRALKGKKYQREIAAQFGVSRELVGLIHRSERWGWL